MTSLPNPADIRYGGFYLPVFSLLYIYQEIGLPVELPLPYFKLVLSEANISIVIGLTILGAIIGHGASRAIYGVDGAKINPKNRKAVLWYRNLLTLKKKPGRPPKSINHLTEKLEHSINWFEELSTVSKGVIVLYRLTRFTVIWPAKLVFLGVVLLTTGVLTVSALQGTLQLLGAVLLVGQLVFFFGRWVFNRFPTAVPVESAPWIYLAEYDKAEYLHEKGDIDFEYGPLNFRQSVLDEFEETQSSLQSPPHDYDEEDIDWLVPIEDPEPEYVITLEERPTDKEDE